jgi:multiple sugar transport system substrate-binding protein
LKKGNPGVKFIVGHALKNKSRVAYGTIAGYGMFKQSKNPNQVAQWLKFFTSTQNVAEFCKTFNFIPPRTSSDGAVMQANTDAQFQFAVKESVHARGNLVHPLTQALMLAVLPELQAAVVHKKTVDQALVDADAAINQVLQGQG